MTETKEQQQNEQNSRLQAQARAQAQAQQQQQAAKSQVVSTDSPQDIIKENIKGDEQAHKTNEALSLLKRIVGLASPVVEDQEGTVEQKDANGNVNNVPVTKKVTTGYTYYAVNGKPFEKWLEEVFGGDITVDTKENKIKYNKPIEEIVAKDPQPEQKEEQLKKGVRTEQG